jgi:mannose-6-phosphate isomerase-like protein (cupin superfamily)
MMPPTRVWTREEMMKRVVRYADAKGSKHGLPDSELPECERELINVLGFRPPDNEITEMSPLGSENARSASIDISEGFNLGFIRAKPGKGPLMHNHDTNETFMPITGTWRCEWNEGDDHEFIDVGPLDVVSFPPGVIRRFMNVTEGEQEVEHVLQVIIGGDAPAAEFSDAAWKRIHDFEAENSSG